MSTALTIQPAPERMPEDRRVPASALPAGPSQARAEESGSAEERHRVVRAEVLARFATLSRRERDVFVCLMAGRTNRVTAAELGLSDKTVEEYRAKVMSKMQAHSLADLVKMAVLAGETDPYALGAGPH